MSGGGFGRRFSRQSARSAPPLGEAARRSRLASRRNRPWRRQEAPRSRYAVASRPRTGPVQPGDGPDEDAEPDRNAGRASESSVWMGAARATAANSAAAALADDLDGSATLSSSAAAMRRGVAAQADVGAHVRRDAAGGGSEFQRARAAAHGEAAVEQVRGLLGAQLRRRRAEHHHDETPAGMTGGRHDVEPGRTGEAGLHAVGAGIAPDKPVVVGDDLIAELQARRCRRDPRGPGIRAAARGRSSPCRAPRTHGPGRAVRSD